ncbi:hypothetical protein KIPB_014210 [Kipferlia bialata]|uniref:Uncharacterized protein n=1 Tax=Kipferlia bialata TaxID=797122 RepID=A0A9K3DA15_9EUKA|nr:hypothetical protein KIPB_014210 [Kipferlia bialata]|eukprot:g14210.t1
MRTMKPGPHPGRARPVPPAPTHAEVRIEIESRHLLEREALIAEHKEILAAALETLEDKQELELEEHDATLPGKGRPCGTCDKECKAEDHFLCAKCNQRHCNTHKDGMTTCVECEKSYCDACLRDVDRCMSCEECGSLRCCGLTQMPCGRYEDEECYFRHVKSCHCQKGRW